MKTIAINGFGRIGKTFLRVLAEDSAAWDNLNVAAINIGPSPSEFLDVLFAHDSVMGPFKGAISCNDNSLILNGKAIAILAEQDPSNINWRSYGIDWVVEASGKFTTKNQTQKHCLAGAKKVLITAPSKDADITVIPGVNLDAFNAAQHTIVSLGSCTTNCFAPVVKILHDAFGLISGSMVTVHSYTNDQVLLDVQHHDPRRARAAGVNIIPTKTGASALISVLFPHLADRMHAYAIRVPTPDVSLLDLSFETRSAITINDINQAFMHAAQTTHKGIVATSTLPLVSSDFKGNSASAIVDLELSYASLNHGRVVAWYDNEWGYSSRLKDFLLHNC